MILAQGSRPVFIVGCERSGTTLLRAMLDNHPKIAIPHEAERFSSMFPNHLNIWQQTWKASEIQPMIHAFLRYEKVQHWKITADEIIAGMDGRSIYAFKDILELIYSSYAKRNAKVRWGDKTPSNTFEMPDLIEAFPESQFIHIVRDGRDVYLSWKKAYWVKYDVVQAAEQWRKWTFAAHRHRHRLGKKRYLMIRFEDLVDRSVQTLERVMSFLQEPFAEEMLRYYERSDYVPVHGKPFHELLSRPPDKDRIFSWKKNMLQSEKELFDHSAKRELIEYGYETDPGIRTFFSLRGLLAWSRKKLTEINESGS